MRWGANLSAVLWHKRMPNQAWQGIILWEMGEQSMQNSHLLNIRKWFTLIQTTTQLIIETGIRWWMCSMSQLLQCLIVAHQIDCDTKLLTLKKTSIGKRLLKGWWSQKVTIGNYSIFSLTVFNEEVDPLDIFLIH